jgi:hypothetical protein
MAFEIVQIQPRIFYAKFDDCENMLLSTFRIDGSRQEHKNEYENYRQYIRKYMDRMRVSGYCIYSRDFRWFMKKFKKKKAINEEINFTLKVLNSVGEAGLSPRSKFNVIVCHNNENSIAFNHEMAHSMFNVNYKYKMKVLRLFKHIKPEVRQKMLEVLATYEYQFKGTDDQNFIDECNARIATENLIKKGFSEDIRLPQKQIDQFKKLYQDNLKSQ